MILHCFISSHYAIVNTIIYVLKYIKKDKREHMNLLKIIITNGLFPLLTVFALYTQETATETTASTNTQQSQQTGTDTTTATQSTSTATQKVEENKETPVQTTTTTEQKPEEGQTATTEQKPEEQTTKETEMTNWTNHLQALKTKGGPDWDAAANTPTTDWQNKAKEIATSIVEKDISHADELKTAYLTALEDKYSNIEKTEKITGFFNVIKSFNDVIDEIV